MRVLSCSFENWVTFKSASNWFYLQRCDTTANFDLLRTLFFWQLACAHLSIALKIESLSNWHQIDSICKGVILRPILTSSGTLFFWHRACAYLSIALKIETLTKWHQIDLICKGVILWPIWSAPILAASRVRACVYLAIVLKIESLSNWHQIDLICKGVILRPILASSGSSLCWVQACALQSKFLFLSHSLTYIRLVVWGS